MPSESRAPMTRGDRLFDLGMRSFVWLSIAVSVGGIGVIIATESHVPFTRDALVRNFHAKMGAPR